MGYLMKIQKHKTKKVSVSARDWSEEKSSSNAN